MAELQDLYLRKGFYYGHVDFESGKLTITVPGFKPWSSSSNEEHAIGKVKSFLKASGFGRANGDLETLTKISAIYADCVMKIISYEKQGGNMVDVHEFELIFKPV